MRYFRSPEKDYYRPRCRLLLPCSEWVRVVRRRSKDREKFFVLSPTALAPQRVNRMPFSPRLLFRSISTSQLNPLLGLHRQPINLVVSEGSYPRAEREGGYFILGWASHLDAFSGYPKGMWLPSDALDSNNWHTRDSPSQVLSYCGQLPSSIQRLLRIEAELSYACKSIITNSEPKQSLVHRHAPCVVHGGTDYTFTLFRCAQAQSERGADV